MYSTFYPILIPNTPFVKKSRCMVTMGGPKGYPKIISPWICMWIYFYNRKIKIIFLQSMSK